MTKQELINFADFQDGDRVWIMIMRQNGDVETLIRRNAGFDALQVMGLASLGVHEIAEQIQGVKKPDMIKRESIAKDAKISKNTNAGWVPGSEGLVNTGGVTGYHS